MEQQIVEIQEWLEERIRQLEDRYRLFAERLDTLRFQGFTAGKLEERRRMILHLMDELRLQLQALYAECRRGTRKRRARSGQTRQCVICWEAVNKHDVRLSLCGHFWCRPCIIKRFESAANSTHQFPAQCCGTPIVPDNHAIIKPETRTRYLERKAEVETPNPTFCSKRECAKFIPLQRITEGQARCVCGRVTCADCKAEYHTGECVVDAATDEFLNLAQREHWQKCPRCGTMTDRIDGCNEMSKSNSPVPCRGFCF